MTKQRGTTERQGLDQKALYFNLYKHNRKSLKGGVTWGGDMIQCALCKDKAGHNVVNALELPSSICRQSR